MVSSSFPLSYSYDKGFYKQKKSFAIIYQLIRHTLSSFYITF